jgi:hypothetical protein
LNKNKRKLDMKKKKINKVWEREREVNEFNEQMVGICNKNTNNNIINYIIILKVKRWLILYFLKQAWVNIWTCE